MNKIKKISWMMISLLTFQAINCSENPNSQDLEFPSHTTEKYIYNKTVSQQDHQSSVWSRNARRRSTCISPCIPAPYSGRRTN